MFLIQQKQFNPGLEDPSSFSSEFQDFVNNCVQIEPFSRKLHIIEV